MTKIKILIKFNSPTKLHIKKRIKLFKKYTVLNILNLKWKEKEPKKKPEKGLKNPQIKLEAILLSTKIHPTCSIDWIW